LDVKEDGASAGTTAVQPPLSAAKAALLDRWKKGRPAATPSGVPAIPRAADRGVLSFAQQRLWFLHRLDPASPAYSMLVVRRLRGDVDEAALDRALVEFVRRHEVLRTTLAADAQGSPRAVVHDAPATLLAARDVASEAELRALLDEEARLPLDLERGPILRARLYRPGPRERVLLVAVHHAAFDEASETVLDRELSALYAAFAAGRPSPLPEPPVQYADFAHWQRGRAAGPAFERELARWRRRLEGVAPLELPTDRPRPPAQAFAGRTLAFRLDAPTTAALRALCRAEGVTHYMALLAAFQAFLHRHAGQDDFAVASPISGRSRPELEGLAGFFVNTLVLRADLSGEPTFRELLARVKAACLEAYASPDVPFERLVEELHPARDPSRAPLAQAFYAHQNGIEHRLSLPGAEAAQEWLFTPTSKWDLSLFTLDEPDGVRCWLEHSTDLWDEATGERFARRFQALVAALALDPGQSIADAPLLPDDEARLLAAWNDTAADVPRACVQDLVAEQARRTPDALAVACGPERLTHAALDARAQAVAAHLRARGAGRGTLVALLVGRSAGMVAALLGILRAGAAYVPLDPSYPAERLAYMLQDSGARFLLTTSGLASGLPAHGAEVVLLDDVPEAGDAPAEPVTPDDLAYVIYTSGSTGRPKGTRIPHRALTNFLHDMRARLGVGPGDRWLSVTTLSFDIAGLEVYLPLLAGATVEVATADEVRDPALLLGRMRGATVLQATPATWRMLLDSGWTSDVRLRKALSGGEALPPAVARGLLSHADEVWNLYGPTETTIWSTAHRLDPRDARVPIGRPIANTRAHVVDARQRPVPIGVPGELLLGGAGLAEGYHARPELTAERFPDWRGERVYRTGDRVRWLADGTLEHLGRLDRQVKVRGHRVELGEVEAALLEHVREAAVVARHDALVAYVVPREEGAAPTSPAAAKAVVDAWRPVFDARAEDDAADPTFDTGVWTSSFTGRPIPRHEMEEWVEATVERIRSLRPRRVLEIGCGTGLLLWRVAPLCEAYHGTDLSGATLARLRRALDERGVANVRLLEREATDFSGLDDAYDLVVINSVAQYFPDADYLARVLEQAAARVKEGAILVGDVRSLPLQRAFHAAVERARAGGPLAPEELERRVDARVAADAELLLHPAFFDALRARVPAIRAVRVLPRAGRHRNEMSAYRYDVVLHVGSAPPAVAVPEWRAWPGRDAFRALLAGRPPVLAFAAIPNARLGEGVEPDDLVADARAAGYAAELSWAAARPDGSFDAVLAPGEHSPVADVPRPPPPRALASEPLRARARRERRRALPAELRARLAERLPDAMVPTTVVVLDAMPLTPNGKVDRNALPAHDAERPGLAEEFVAPRTPGEEVVARVWRDLLGLERVGVRDGFFALGGHSLLAAQMVARLRDALGVEIPLRAVFERPTVEAIAALRAAPAQAPLAPLAQRDGVPLSPGQERLWFLHQLDPASPAYNVALALRLRGPLRVDALRRALDGVAARHEALRTVVARVDGAPVQRILPPAPVPLRVLEARDEGHARALAQDAAHEPFDLARGPLFRAALARVGPEDHLLALCAHHIVFDEGSEPALLRDLAALYEGAPLPPVALQQGDLTERERGRDVEAAVRRTTERLAGLEAAEVPTDRPRPPVQTFRGESVAFDVPAQGLRALARSGDATLFMALAAACQAFLRRHGGSDDVALGAPAAGRDAPGAEDVVGFLVNLLVLRTDLSGDPTLRELLLRAKAACLAAYADGAALFERVVKASGAARDLGRTPLFQAALVLQGPPAPLRLQGLQAEREPIASRVAKFDLTVWVADEGERLRVTLEANADLFEPARIGRMARDLAAVLRAFGGAPGARLSALPAPDDEARGWVGHKRPPDPRTVTALFAEQAARGPGKVAVSAEGASLTYAELDSRSTALAARLQARGVGRDDRVGVCLERSADAVVALLGVLKAGGAYVPLDPAHPDARLASALRDAGARALVTRASLRTRMEALGAPPVLVDDPEPAPPFAPVRVEPDDLAYVMYTSGSTGTPKGVMVPHRAVVRLVTGQDYVPFGPDETFLQYAPLAFDAATFEVWGALLHGARLAVAPPRTLAAHELGALLKAEGVTTLWLTAPLFHLMVDEAVDGLRGLRQLVAGGDALSPPHVRRALAALPGLRLVNGYGPTECTTFACCHPVTEPPGDRVPIGRPLAGTLALVLDPHGKPVPVGAPGELHLGGDGLARGYLGAPGLTAQRFVERDGERLYRTGDLARWRNDGALEFLGRLDQQVKIRGHRVEPGEVEAALAEHPDVAEAAVVARADAHGGRRLVAYVVPARGRAPDAEALREHVRRRLPDAFVPAAVVALGALPLTANGKVDRKALPEPAQEGSRAFVAPEGHAEETLAALAAQTLGAGRVGAEDDLFALGFDSILATRLVARVRQAFDVDLPLPAVFDAPTVRGLARALAARDGAPRLPPIVPSPRDGADAPLSFGQQRLWFLQQWRPASPAYNNPGAFRIRGPLDAAALEAALDGVVRRHEVLRTVYPAPDGTPVQRVLPHAPLRLDVVDVEDEEAALRLARGQAERPFDLARETPFRARLARLAPDDHVLALTFHHVAFDGWSVGVLFRDLSELYAARVEGRAPRLPALPVQYADFARWQREHMADLGPQVAAWRERLAGLRPLDLPADRPRPASPTLRGHETQLAIPARTVRALEDIARREGATLYMALLAAWATLLHRHAGTDDVAVGSPVAGRRAPEAGGLVGFFVNTLVLRADLSGAPTFREALARVRRTCLDAYARQDVPFERLVEELHPERDPSRAPLVQVLFALQERAAPAFPGSGLRVEELPCPTGAAKLDLSLSLAPDGDGLRGAIEASADLFDPATVRRYADRFAALLEGIVADPSAPIARLPVMDAGERDLTLRAWNETETPFPQDLLLHQLFERHADRTPDAPAIEDGSRAVTYAELDRWADRLARRLRRLGAGPESIVALHLDRSVEAYAAILGVLKSGAAYLPLDVAHPRGRLASTLEDAGVRLVVTRAGLQAALPAGDAAVVLADDPTLADEPEGRVPPETTPDGLAYVIYTSGSTGRPKGVLIEHRGAVNFATGFAARFAAGPRARLLQMSSLAVDMSVAELALSVLDGGTLVLAPPDECIGEALRDTLARRQVSALLATPGVLATATPADLPGLRVVMSGADSCPADVAAAWSAGRRMMNGYGPTEITVCAAVADCPPGVRAAPPLGRPLPNTRLYVLDAHGEPAPIGVPGELHIGGAGVARGYLGRPDLTAERFVPDPFSGEPGARMYRSGDLCRLLPDGQVEFLGRIDAQVKVRGFRIESGEVEACLRAHPKVRDAVVAARDNRLVAYVVGEATAAELRDHARAALPEPMVPSLYVPIAAVPLSPNGKVDRAALPAPDASSAPAASHVAPQGAVEEALARAWGDLLGVPRVGANDGFFELGGHSLLVPRLVARVRGDLGVELPLSAVFEAPTLGALARRVEAAQAARAASPAPAPAAIRRVDRARYQRPEARV
jgi:amino acid adenylation domain-containing protein